MSCLLPPPSAETLIYCPGHVEMVKCVFQKLDAAERGLPVWPESV